MGVQVNIFDDVKPGLCFHILNRSLPDITDVYIVYELFITSLITAFKKVNNG